MVTVVILIPFIVAGIWWLKDKLLGRPTEDSGSVAGMMLGLLVLWLFLGGMVADTSGSKNSESRKQAIVVEDGVAREIHYYCEAPAYDRSLWWFWPGAHDVRYRHEARTCWEFES